MKRISYTPFTVLLALAMMASAFDAGAQPDNPSTAGPVANAAGPYSGVVGSEVAFSGAGSSGSILTYLWGFGDGTTGNGKAATHRYQKDGSYHVTLKVTDDQGRSDISSAGAYIRPQTVQVNITVDPRKDGYEPGDVISGVDADVYFSGGQTAEGAHVSGSLYGREKIPLIFAEAGSGRYHADLSYPVLNVERGFLNISVEAKDDEGKISGAAKKLTLVPENPDSVFLSIDEPTSGHFAYGQEIGFTARFYRVKDHKNMDDGSIVLYEGWSNRTFSFGREDRNYSLRYRIPADAGDSLNFLIYGSGRIVDTRYSTVNDLSFEITHDLAVDVISPGSGTFAPDVKGIKAKVTYPDGTVVGEPELTAYIGSDPIVLKRSGEFYAADYSLPGNESDIDLWVTDAFGNGGGAKVFLSAVKPPAKEGDVPLGTQIAYSLVPVIGLLIVLFLAYRFFSGRRNYRASLMKEYEETSRKIESLKLVKDNIMNEFYTLKISEGEARNRVLDCEKELVIERHRLKSIGQKLGMRAADGEGEPTGKDNRK